MDACCPQVERAPMTNDSVHSYKLREARAADVTVLAGIEVEAFSDPWSTSAFTDVLHMPSARTTVMVNTSDVPVAYCVLMTAADQGEIANLAVTKRAHRLGLGAKLLADALDFARARLVVAVYLEVRESNAAARALYRSKDFREIGRRKGYYQRPPEDALVLQWTGTT